MNLFRGGKMKAVIGNRLKSSSLCILLVPLIFLLSSCTQAATLPDVSADEVEKWQAAYDVDLDSEKIYQENIHLFDYDELLPLDVVEVESWEDGGVTFTDITYASPKGGRVPATIIEPPGPGPFAGIIMQHGLPSIRQSMFNAAKRYAKFGAVVIAIDAPFARPENADRMPLLFTEQDRADHIQLMVDLRRAVDYLVSKPNVDPNRLGYVGISYGAMAGGLFAGLEDRLQAYVLVVGDGGLVHHSMVEIEMKTPLEEMSEKEKKQWIDAMWPIESIHYVSHAKPAALLYQNGTQDRLVPSYLALIYQNAGSAPKTIKWYEGGHGLTFEHFLDQLAWMSQYIGITDVRSLPTVKLFLMNPAEDFILLNGHLRTTALVIDRFLLVWFAFVLGSIFFLAWDLWRITKASNRAKLNWLLAALFFGPLALWAYFYTNRNGDMADLSHTAIRKRTIRSTIWGVAGNLIGMIGVIGILEMEAFPDDLLYSISAFLLIPLIFGLPLLTRWALDKFTRERSEGGENRAAQRHAFWPILISTNMVLAVGCPLFAALIDKWLFRWYQSSSWNLGSPPFWAIASLAAITGAAIDYPTHLQMIKHGLLDWRISPPPDEPQKTKPSRLKVVGAVFISYLVLLACFWLAFYVIL
jgi:dienelactone hydrolase